MNKCTNCGSHAINPHLHGRGGDRLDLCDVCYWRARFDALREAVAKMRELENAVPSDFVELINYVPIRIEARAEVDRLIANEGAANCEGEG